MFRIRRYLVGYMICVLKNGQFYRFINICKSNRVYLWHIHYTEEGVMFNALAPDEEFLDEAAIKCGGRMVVVKRCGLPFFIERNRRHRYFFAGIVLAVFCVYVMSRYIWNVEITGNYQYSEGTINTFLNDIGAGCGTKKKRLVPSEIEEEIRIQYPKIAWVSVQIIGTKLLVTIEEGVSPEKINEEVPMQIKAEMEGTVLSIVTRKGTPLVHAGDQVKAGDVLIEGHVDVMGDDQTVVETLQTGADGDVLMEYLLPVSKTFFRSYEKKIYTGNEKKGMSLRLFNREFHYGARENPYKYADLMPAVKAYRLTTHFYLPMVTEEIIYKEYVAEKAMYTDDELEAQVQEYLNHIIREIHTRDGQVSENQTMCKYDRKKCILSGYLKVVIPAGKASRLDI